MKLANLLPQKLAEWRCDNDRSTLTVACPESGWTADVTADHADAIGCRLWEVTVRPTAARPETDLRARAERIAGRVTGLLEPLQLIEVDDPRQTAQLRSKEPSRQGDDLFYYEALLHGDGKSTVRRFQTTRQATAPREQTPFALTHEALTKLVGDLTE